MRKYSNFTRSFLCLGIAVLGLSHRAFSQDTEVIVAPGQSIAEAVLSHSPGTTFHIKPGIYRDEDIVPKAGDRFTGEPGAILNGSHVLSFQQEGGLWVAHNQTQHLPVHGSCDANHPMCSASEDLFFDGKPLLRVADRNSISAGSWFFDYPSQSIYVADNPAGHVVETSILTSAFRGNAPNVVIEGLIIEKYGAPAQSGAIGATDHPERWLIRNNEVRLNHGDGLHVSSIAHVLGNKIHHNGHMGVGCSFASDVLVENNEIAFNNFAGFQTAWEAGGLKCTFTENIVLRGNIVHDNIGPGLWLDTDNEHALYENNRIYNNTDNGIQYEISFDAVIRNNQLWNNGDAQATWLWRSQILIQNSQNVNVYGNAVLVAPGYGNGIGIIQQNRKGSERLGRPYLASNNYVHDNEITYLAGANRTSGLVGDFSTGELYAPGNQGNRFDFDHYHLADTHCECLRWNGTTLSFQAFQATGQEVHGTLDHNASKAAFRP